MRIEFAHLREKSMDGGWTDFAVFGARSSAGTSNANALVLARLSARARNAGLKIDQSALAYHENGRWQFYGSKNLVDYLAVNGSPMWTHSLDD